MGEERISCSSCGTSYNKMFLIGRQGSADTCPMCGASFGDDGDMPQGEKKTWYYYEEGGGGLDDTLYSQFTPLYTFEATDLNDAKNQLKKVMPNSPLLSDNAPGKVRCPKCGCTEVQLVPRKFSLLTGFATNRVDRMCVRCKNKF